MEHAITVTAIAVIGFAAYLLGRAAVWTEIEEENKKADPLTRIDLH
jgi:hypothetical protein